MKTVRYDDQVSFPVLSGPMHSNSLAYDVRLGLVTGCSNGDLNVWKDDGKKLLSVLFAPKLGQIVCVSICYPHLLVVCAEGLFYLYDCTSFALCARGVCATSATACCCIQESAFAVLVVIGTVDRIVETFSVELRSSTPGGGGGAPTAVVEVSGHVSVFQVTSPIRNMHAIPKGSQSCAQIICGLYAGHLALLRLAYADCILLEECPFSHQVTLSISVEMLRGNEQAFEVHAAYENGSHFGILLSPTVAGSLSVRRLWGPYITAGQVSCCVPVPQGKHFRTFVTTFCGKTFVLPFTSSGDFDTSSAELLLDASPFTALHCSSLQVYGAVSDPSSQCIYLAVCEQYALNKSNPHRIVRVQSRMFAV
eukprot:ANDGO_00775.mRNA.1 hypothetical protein